jgi:hypothetical protein
VSRGAAQRRSPFHEPRYILLNGASNVTTLIVLFNLKDSASAADYEQWARSSDLPTVNALRSVDSFEAFKGLGLLGGGVAPYQYYEIIRVNDMNLFGEEVGTDTMKKMAAAFNTFADAPLFILTEAL